MLDKYYIPNFENTHNFESSIITGISNRPSSGTSALQNMSVPKANMNLKRTCTKTKAGHNWTKIKHALHFITKASAKVPTGVKVRH